MTNEITMNALVAKRAEILFEISKAEKRTAQRQAKLVHLDAVLRMFRRDFKAEGLPVQHRRPAKSPYFKGSELTQRILKALRINGTVTTSFEVSAQAMRNNGLHPENATCSARARWSGSAGGGAMRWQLATMV